MTKAAAVKALMRKVSKDLKQSGFKIGDLEITEFPGRTYAALLETDARGAAWVVEGFARESKKLELTDVETNEEFYNWKTKQYSPPSVIAMFKDKSPN